MTVTRAQCASCLAVNHMLMCRRCHCSTAAQCLQVPNTLCAVLFALHRAAELTAQTAEERAAKLQERLQEAEAAWKCGICTDRNVNTVLMPCAHMLCSDCVTGDLQGMCPFCRNRFTTKPLHN
jgi:Prokaryotic RING finger family 4